MIHIKPGENGCSEMPDLRTDSLIQAYIQLSKKYLVPCGFTRISKSYFESRIAGWIRDSGDAIRRNVGTYILSVDEKNLTAQVFKPSPTHDPEFFCKPGMGARGRITRLTVRLTDTE
jgi:hypothetical protein